MPEQNIDINSIRQALLARGTSPAMNQGQTTPMLSQVGQPIGSTPTGGSPTITNTPPTIPAPNKPQPQFSSPFAGPKVGVTGGLGFDDETRRMSKSLISKLLQVL